MIVDDVQQNIEIVKIYLEDAGIVFGELTSGKDVVAFAKTFKPDLILMDLRMPVVTGYDANAMLKKDETTKSIPVVAFTASSMKSDEKRIRKEFPGFLRKPVQKKELLKELIRFLPYNVILGAEPEVEQFGSETYELGKEQRKKLLVITNELISLFSERSRNLLDYMDLSEIGIFINDMNSFCIKNSYTLIDGYIKALKEDYNNFDIPALKKRLIQLPEFFNNTRTSL
jgi:CheY-like chemotaxis protein